MLSPRALGLTAQNHLPSRDLERCTGTDASRNGARGSQRDSRAPHDYWNLAISPVGNFHELGGTFIFDHVGAQALGAYTFNILSVDGSRHHSKWHG